MSMQSQRICTNLGYRLVGLRHECSAEGRNWRQVISSKAATKSLNFGRTAIKYENKVIGTGQREAGYVKEQLSDIGQVRINEEINILHSSG
jgi:hypothetical protein